MWAVGRLSLLSRGLTAGKAANHALPGAPLLATPPAPAPMPASEVEAVHLPVPGTVERDATTPPPPPASLLGRIVVPKAERPFLALLLRIAKSLVNFLRQGTNSSEKRFRFSGGGVDETIVTHLEYWHKSELRKVRDPSPFIVKRSFEFAVSVGSFGRNDHRTKKNRQPKCSNRPLDSFNRLCARADKILKEHYSLVALVTDVPENFVSFSVRSLIAKMSQLPECRLAILSFDLVDMVEDADQKAIGNGAKPSGLIPLLIKPGLPIRLVETDACFVHTPTTDRSREGILEHRCKITERKERNSAGKFK